jgi:hypothetical protein
MEACDTQGMRARHVGRESATRQAVRTRHGGREGTGTRG